jgi:hypothetical protein
MDTERSSAETLAAATNDGERLALARREIAAAEAELRRLGAERQQHVVAALAGEAEAKAAIARIDGETAAATVRLADWRQAAAVLEVRLREAAADEAAGQAAARRRETAAGRAVLADLAAQIQGQAQQLGEAMREARATLLRLAAVSGNQQVKRLAERLPEVYRNTLSRSFQIDPEGQPRAANSLLQMAPEWVGEMSRRSLGQVIENLLDDTAALFADEAAALACRERLAARQTPALILPLEDGLLLVARRRARPLPRARRPRRRSPASQCSAKSRMSRSSTAAPT